MVFLCTHCGQSCKSRGGLSQHISQKQECADKERVGLGYEPTGRQKKVSPPKRPGMPGGGFAKFVPRAVPFTGRFTRPNNTNPAVRPKIVPIKASGLQVKSNRISDQDVETMQHLQDLPTFAPTERNHKVDERYCKTVHFEDDDDDPFMQKDDELSEDDELEVMDLDDMEGNDDNDVLEGEEDFNRDGNPNAHVDRKMRDDFGEYCDKWIH